MWGGARGRTPGTKERQRRGRRQSSALDGAIVGCPCGRRDGDRAGAVEGGCGEASWAKRPWHGVGRTRVEVFLAAGVVDLHVTDLSQWKAAGPSPKKGDRIALLSCAIVSFLLLFVFVAGIQKIVAMFAQKSSNTLSGHCPIGGKFFWGMMEITIAAIGGGTGFKGDSIMRRFVLAAVMGLWAGAVWAQDGDQQAQEALRSYVGNWKSAVKDAPALFSPQGGEHNDYEFAALELKNRLVMGRILNEENGQKAFWVMTYDRRTKTYPLWFFSENVVGGKWSGKWDGATKSMRSHAEGLPQGWTSEATSSFVDKNAPKLTMWIKDDAGGMALDTKVEKQPLDAGASAKWIARWEANGRGDQPLDAEQKVLDRLAGVWEAKLSYLPSRGMPEAKEGTRRLKGEWAVGGRYLISRASDSDGMESLFIATYDPQQQKYRQWRFTSGGIASETSGEWDEAQETMTWTGQMGDGRTTKLAAKFSGTDRCDWAGATTDAEGTKWFEMKGSAQRQRK